MKTSIKSISLYQAKKRRERSQITNIKNESRAITTDLMDIKRITEEYYEQLYAHKFDNQMDQFFERHNLSKLKKKWMI